MSAWPNGPANIEGFRDAPRFRLQCLRKRSSFLELMGRTEGIEEVHGVSSHHMSVGTKRQRRICKWRNTTRLGD